MSTAKFSKAKASADGADQLLTYIPFNWPSLAYSLSFQNSASNPFARNYLYLGATSGNEADGYSSYAPFSLELPNPGDSFGFVRRAIINLRYTFSSIPSEDLYQIVPSEGVNAPSVAISNLSTGQAIYVGFKPTDFFSSFTESAAQHVTIPYGAVRQVIFPFFGSLNDNIEICLISPSVHNHRGVLSIQLANFDIPIIDKTEIFGWQDSAL